MALYFADRKCTCTFRLNVCRGNVVKDVNVAIVLFQLAVASGPARVPCVLCELLKAGDVCVHGSVIPGPGREKPHWMPWAALSGLFSPLVLCWRSPRWRGIHVLLC